MTYKLTLELSHEGCPMTLKEDTSMEVAEHHYNSPSTNLYRCKGCGTTFSVGMVLEDANGS